MKQIKEFIESNKKWIEDLKQEIEEMGTKTFTDPLENALNESEIERIKKHIHDIEMYVKGLEDAKKYIEEEQ